MANALATAPTYFRTPVSRGGEPRVEREGGYRGAGLIRGVSVITKGEALGHGLWIDDVTLAQVTEAINAGRYGIKSRFTHPGLSGDGLGKQVGRVMDAEAAGDQVLADQHFIQSAHKAPDGDLAEYLMSLAEEDPEGYGLSIAFKHDAEAMERFVAEHSTDGSFRSPDPDNLQHLPHVRIQEIRAADAVDEPAANPNGLFHREQDIAREADSLAAYALGISSVQPETIQLGLDPDRVRGFVSRFLSNHKLEIQQMADESAQPTSAPVAGIKVGDRVTVKPGSEHDQAHAGEVGTVGVEATPALGVRFDSEPETVYRWYTEDELEPATDEAPAEPAPDTVAPETPVQAEANDRSESQRFKDAFGDQGLVWHFGEGLSYDQCRERQLAEMQKEIESLKAKLAARPADGEDSPVTFDNRQETRSGFASKIRVK